MSARNRKKPTTKKRASKSAPVERPTLGQGFTEEDADFLRRLNTAGEMPASIAKLRVRLYEQELYDVKQAMTYVELISKYNGLDATKLSLNDFETLRQCGWWLVCRATRALMWRDGADRMVGEPDERPRNNTKGDYVPVPNRALNVLLRAGGSS